MAVLAVVAAALLLAGRLVPGGAGAARPQPEAAARTAASGASATGPAVSTPSEVRAPWRPGAPRQVRVPALGVGAPVVPVSAPGGTLVPPRSPQVLGWWADGARPGAAHGSAVITGHSVHGPATGALERIAELQAGATVLVRTDRRLLRYTVTRVETLDKDALTVRAQRLFSPHGRARLVLVTCGDWDGRHYRSNVVAVALPAAGDQGGAGE